MPTRFRLRFMAWSGVLLCLWGQVSPLRAASRFPRPEFTTEHQLPTIETPAPRVLWQERLDVAVLALCLVVAAWLVLKQRSRRGVVLLTLFCLLYFGFWRRGCVCPVGSIQNVALALFDSTYALPVTVVLFCVLPLLAALFFGRVFCAAVCPLGGIQDLVAIRPRRVPFWLQQVLGLVPVVVLGLTVLMAALGAWFPVCDYDPFIAVFRLGGTFRGVLLAAGTLLVAVVVARPYCRFFCPYGVLLGWLSRLAWKRTTITPDICVQCRLCEDSCPFGAINAPTGDRPPETPDQTRRRFGRMLVLIPLLVLLGTVTGWALGPTLSRAHRDVALVLTLDRESRIPPDARGELSLESQAFLSKGRSITELMAGAREIRERFQIGGAWLGGFVGLVLGGRLAGTARRRRRADYEADRYHCLSCARCFSYCPREQLKKPGPAEAAPAVDPHTEQKISP